MSQQALLCTPPQKRSRVDSFFSHRCLVSLKIFLKVKVDFAGDIRIGAHKSVVLRHNHSNPISTKLALFNKDSRIQGFKSIYLQQPIHFATVLINKTYSTITRQIEITNNH